MKTQQSPWGLHIFFLALAWIFAACLTMPILPLFYIEPPYLTVFLTSALSITVLALATWRPRNALITGGLLVLVLIWMLFFSATPFWHRVDGVVRIIIDGVESMNGYATIRNQLTPGAAIPPPSEDVLVYHNLVSMLVSFGVSAFAYVVLGRAKWPWLMVAAVGGVITANLIIGIQTHVFWLLPAALITMLVFVWSNRIENQGAVQSVRSLLLLTVQTAVPLVLAMALALAITPRVDYWEAYSPTLQKLTQDVVSLLPQNFQDKFEIFNFSIRQAGYYPLGDRLGGPLNLTNEPMLEIWGEPGYFLKGSSANIYDGQRWTNEMTNPHYRFNSAFNVSQQTEVMSTETPIVRYLPDDAQEAVVQRHAYAILPIIDNVQVVFSDGVLTDVSTHRDDRTDFYFNQAGLVYADDIFTGDKPFWAESSGLQPAIVPNLQLSDPELSAVQPTAAELDYAIGQLVSRNTLLPDEEIAFENYLQLPNLPEYQPGGVVHDLSQNLIRGARTDYEQIIRIYDYLGRNPEFTYSTDVEIPPDGAEFVSHFLATQEGYCTYYASALTMMARSVGIPARYVEGFAVAPEAQGRLTAGAPEALEAIDVETGEMDGFPSAVLTARNAHAWTEVYLRGIGWVPLDPTPGGAGGDSLPIEPIEEPEPTPPLDPTPTPDPDQTGTPTPTPTPIPDEELSPSPTPGIDDEDGVDPEAGTASRILASVGRILLVLLLLATIAGAAWLYYRSRLRRRELFHNPRLLAAKVRDPKDQITTYWHQILKLLTLLPPGRSPARLNLEQQMDWHLSNKSAALEPLAEQLREAVPLAERAYFSKHEPSEDEIHSMAEIYSDAEARIADELGTFRYYTRRLLLPGSFTITRRNGDEDR